MSNWNRFFTALLLVCAVLLPACRTPQGEPTATDYQAEAVFTAAAHTAQAKLTDIAAITPTPSPTESKVTPVPATATHTLFPATTSTVTPSTQSGNTGSLDSAAYVADITVADGMQFQPGESFVKTWRLKNTGTSTWNESYALVFFSGSQMSGDDAVPLQADVPPGEIVDVSVELVAPLEQGTYKGYWMLSNSHGDSFGIGTDSKQPFYVMIKINNTASETTSPGNAGNVIGDVTMSVDESNFQGGCPYTFSFPVKLTLNKAAEVSYYLDAGSDEAGYDITLPDPVTVSLGAGSHHLEYELEFETSINGWAKFYVTAPEEASSNQVSFSLKCQ